MTVQIGNRFMNADCIIGPPSSEPQIGQIVLEALDLIADRGSRRLTPRPESPDTPLLKLKYAAIRPQRRESHQPPRRRGDEGGAGVTDLLPFGASKVLAIN